MWTVSGFDSGPGRPRKTHVPTRGAPRIEKGLKSLPSRRQELEIHMFHRFSKNLIFKV